MAEFSISNHAKEQMEFRNVSLEVVMSILTNPKQILTEEGDYLGRIFVNIEKEPNNVITVYRTSKIDKYYEG